MKLQDQVTNLEISKRLKELGVGQGGLFWWIKNSSSQKAIIVGEEYIARRQPDSVEYFYSAFTVAELGELLPDKVYSQDRWYFFLTTWKRVSGEYAVRYKPNTKISHLPVKLGATEADARGKMLIYLLENKLI